MKSPTVAGGIMGHPIELTQAEYVSLPIPAHAEFVIEGSCCMPATCFRRGHLASSPAITGESARRSP